MYSVWENPFHKRYLPETTSQKLKFLTVLRSSHFNIVSVPFFETLEDRKPHQHSPPRLIPFPPFCPLFLSFSIHYSLFSSNNTSSPFYFCRRCCPPPYSILVNGRPLGIPRDTISAASKSHWPPFPPFALNIWWQLFWRTLSNSPKWNFLLNMGSTPPHTLNDVKKCTIGIARHPLSVWHNKENFLNIFVILVIFNLCSHHRIIHLTKLFSAKQYQRVLPSHCLSKKSRKNKQGLLAKNQSNAIPVAHVLV